MPRIDVEEWIAQERERRKDNPLATLWWETMVALKIPHLVAWLARRW